MNRHLSTGSSCDGLYSLVRVGWSVIGIAKSNPAGVAFVGRRLDTDLHGSIGGGSDPKGSRRQE